MNPDLVRGFGVWISLVILCWMASFWVLGFVIEPAEWISVLILLNVSAFGLIFLDKLFAAWHVRRIPELVLWTAGLLGGSGGVLIGMQLFRHKTKKLSFQLVLVLLILLQVALVSYWLTR